MLTKEQRFHGRTALRPVYNKGKAVHGRCFKLIYLPAYGSQGRAAVVVSKKVHKTAVVRNRIRRRLYARLAEMYEKNGIKADVIIVVRDAQLATMPADKLAEEMAGVLEKIVV